LEKRPSKCWQACCRNIRRLPVPTQCYPTSYFW